MSLIQLTESAILDVQNEKGIILHVSEGYYLELNAIATLMIEAAMRFGTFDETLAYLRNYIDATDEMIAKGLRSLENQLSDYRLLVNSK